MLAASTFGGAIDSSAPAGTSVFTQQKLFRHRGNDKSSQFQKLAEYEVSIDGPYVVLPLLI